MPPPPSQNNIFKKKRKKRRKKNKRERKKGGGAWFNVQSAAGVPGLGEREKLARVVRNTSAEGLGFSTPFTRQKDSVQNGFQAFLYKQSNLSE